MDLIADPQAWLSFIVLATLEIVLGIDNLVFLTLAVERLPAQARARARFVGLTLAMLTRLVLLSAVVALARLARPLFEVRGFAVSMRDLVLLTGGVFLIASSVRELARGRAHDERAGGGRAHGERARGERARGERARGEPVQDGRVQGGGRVHDGRGRAAPPRFWRVMLEVALIDILFSFDSVFGAVGLASRVEVMAAAIVVSLPVMMGMAAALGRLIARHRSVRVLALAFLAMVGVYLGAQGLHLEWPRGVLYAALGVAALIELLYLARARRA